MGLMEVKSEFAQHVINNQNPYSKVLASDIDVGYPHTHLDPIFF